MTPEEERSGDLLDVQLADEIELVSDLVVAASSSPRHFTPEEVDELLGVSRVADQPAAADEEPASLTGTASTAPPETPTADGSRGTDPR